MNRKSALLSYIVHEPARSTREIADQMPWPRGSTRVLLHELKRDGLAVTQESPVADDGRGAGAPLWLARVR